MTLGDLLDVSDTWERRLVWLLQLALVGLIGYGTVTGRASVSVTAGLALGVTLLPAVLRREYGYAMDAGLVLWITAAVFLHSLGSIGIYRQYQWYDEVTHTVSSIVVAGFGYASFRALELHSDDVAVPSAFRSLFIVVFVLAAGVLWEVFEYALGDLVPVYGVDDIATDFVFNAIGGLIVAIWGAGHVGGLVGFLRDRLRSTADQ
ncbi:hypothetical protein BDK88_2955 [Natrinema hispanicum]|uniref:Uncharacterized protein n=1 Tax=Natrinema hispanicum TaxID=392421 RepID=A0A482YCA9_9EURY|nr:hypothetical protein [Natrinema hispanicum]RZV08877.1 hypothetical protein BDK88_2955 [Natrinema hispanicum]